MDLNKVRHIEFEITSLCNAACPGCPRTQLGPGIGFDLNTITLKDLQSWLPTDMESIDVFKFSGNLGDPAVNPELYEIIEWLSKTYRKRVIVHTNGGIRNPEWWAKLGKLSHEGRHQFPKDSKWKIVVKWAIDGLEDTNHIYRVGVRWNAVWQNLNAYLDAGGQAEWHFIAFDHNEHQIDDARKLSQELGMMDFKVRYGARNEKSVWVNKGGESIHPSKKMHHPHKQEIIKSEKLIDKSRNTNDDSILKDLSDDVTCIHLEDMNLFIAADQTLWPCCMLYNESLKTSSWARKFIDTLPKDGWNSLKKHSMQEILDNEFYQTLNLRWNMNSKLFTQRCVASCGMGGKFLTKFDKEDK